MEKKVDILRFLREAQERKLITSNSMNKVDSFRKDLERLKAMLPEGTIEYLLCDSLDDKFYELLGELKEEFFALGEISSQLEE